MATECFLNYPDIALRFLKEMATIEKYFNATIE